MGTGIKRCRGGGGGVFRGMEGIRGDRGVRGEGDGWGDHFTFDEEMRGRGRGTVRGERRIS